MSIMAIKADLKIGQTNFHFPKRRAKPWKREVHLLDFFFMGVAIEKILRFL